MRNLKKFLAVLVVVAMIASSMMVAFAAADPSLTPADKAAGLGLLKGDPNNGGVTEEYLNLNTQRIQTAIIYLRMLGKEQEALAYTATTDNFADADQVKDIPGAVNLLAYLRANPQLGWVGDGTNFNPKGEVTGKALYKVMLTCVGYTQGLDFDYDDTIGFARAKGFSLAAYVGYADSVTNNGMAAAMIEALGTTLNGKTISLAQDLVAKNIITAEAADKYTSYQKPVVTPTPTPGPLDFTVGNVATPNSAEYVVTFNQAVAAALLVKGNFQVNGADAGCAVAAADNKSVTVTAASVANKTLQQGDASITVKKAVGLTADTTKKVTAVADTALPTVKSVTIKGNRVVTVVFSEPVVGANQLVNYTIDGIIYPATNPVNDSGDGKTWSFTTNGPIATTAKAFVVNTAVTDFAGLPLAINSTPIQIATDTVLPKAVTLVSATQTSVVVTFDKEMSTPGTVTATGGAVWKSSTVDAADAKKWTIAFNTANPIPPYGATITFANATDVFGNVAATALTLATGTPTIDVARPGFVSVVQGTDQQTLLVTYDKAVALDGTYTVKDTSLKSYAPTVAYNDVTATSDQKVIKLTSTQGNFDTSKSPLTITISGVSDQTPLLNKVVDVSTTLAITDKVAPGSVAAPVATLDNTNHKIFVTFDEDIDPTTALVGNFSFTKNGVVYAMSSIATSTAMVGTRTVVFTVDSATALDAGVGATQISAVNIAAAIKDLAGNTSAAMTAATSMINNATIGLVSAKVTGANSVALVFAAGVDLSKVSYSDFYMVNGAGKVISYVNKAIGTTTVANDTLTLTTNYAFSTDAKVDGSNVTIATTTGATTANAFGTKITAIPTTTLVDGYAPATASSTVDAAYVVNNLATSDVVIKVKLTEPVLKAPLGQVDPATGLYPVNGSEFTVVVDGVNVTAGTTATVETTPAGVGYIKFTVTGFTANKITKAFAVSYLPTAAQTCKDVAGNALGTFSFSGNITAAP